MIHGTKLPILAILPLLVMSSVSAQGNKAKAPVFSKNTFDLGVVVSDLDKAAKFYSDVVGMTEVKGFTAPAEVATRFGLTNNKAVVVRRFVMADMKNAPSLKLMAFPDAPPEKPDQKFIHSTLGFSYLTLFVNDMDAAVARAKKAGVKFEGETPAKVGGPNFLAVIKDPDGNFIELIGPRGKKGEPQVKASNDAFFEAARQGDVVALRKHLDAGQDINAKHNNNAPAVGIAALFGRVEALRFLIENGADVNVQTGDGGTPLHGPSFLGRAEVVSVLLKAGAESNIRNNNGQNAFDECSAPWSDQIETKVKYLNKALGLGISPDAVRKGRPEVLALLRSRVGKPE